MIINNNLSALSAYNNLNVTNNALNKSVQELSTGLRINSSSDDAAGFAVSEKMRSQISGLDAALRNSQDGMSLLQVAEGALSQTNSMLVRMRDLSVQASNDTLTSQDRQHIQMEIDELRDQIDRVANETQFNKRRILDGSSGAIWASSDMNLNVKINGGLVYTDDYGQKVSSEGNYRIEVTASPGEAQVQKTSILDIRETREASEYEPYELNLNAGVDPLGKTSGDGWNIENGVLSITGDGTYYLVGDTTPTNTTINVKPGVTAKIFMKDVNIQVSNNDSGAIPGQCAFYMKGANVDLYVEGTNTLTSGGHRAGIEAPTGSTLTISSASGDYSSDGTLTLNGGYHGAGIGGGCTAGGGTPKGGNITIKGGTINATGGSGAAGIGGFDSSAYESIKIEGGTVNASGSSGAAGIGTGYNAVSNTGTISITGGTVTANGYSGGAGIGGGRYADSGHIEISTNASITASGFTDSTQTQSIGRGSTGSTRDLTVTSDKPDEARDIPEKPEYDANALTQDVHTLADIRNFYNINGVFMLSQPQVITVTQGDGQTASVTLYATDTVYSAAKKINELLAKSFGNSIYTDNPDKFCTVADGTENTSESVYESEEIYDDEGNVTGRETHATMLIRSAIPGKAGELYFSGDEEFLNALGLNTIRESSETTYTARIYDAHTGARVNEMKSEGSEFPSIIPPEIDIEVDSMAGISSKWDEDSKRYVFSEGDTYSANVHLKNNAITFQTGSNEGEDFIIQLGDTSSKALGLSGVNLLTRESASRAISTIDRAISRVSSQRAQIGAYTNSLERNVSNLTVTSTNLTNTESLMRDTDMSQAMMNFVKLQILNQSGTSMLAQANQTPQSVLSLMQ